jgi:hypothetical protein
MTLLEFLSSPERLVGRRVTVEGWLHSDTVNVWLSDRPHSEQELVVVQAPHIATWLLRHIPPRIGGVCAYFFEARVTGVVQSSSRDGVPALGGGVEVVLQHSGSVHLQADCAEQVALCAFCRKSKEEVGPLVESAVPAVYLCYPCARLCAHVIEEECKLRGVPVPEW